MFVLYSVLLWHHVQHAPPRHPLLKKRFDSVRLSPFRERLYRFVATVAPAFLAVNAFLLPTSLAAFQSVVLSVLLMMNLSISLAIALSITAAITRERENGRYDLLSVTMPGALGMGWVLAARQFTRNLHLLYLRQIARRSYLGVLFPVIFILFVVVGVSGNMRVTLIQDGIDPAALSQGVLQYAILAVDYPQSLMTGVLVGLIVASFAGNRSGGVIVTVGAMLGVHLFVYLCVAIGWTLLGGIGLHTPFADVMAVLVLFGVRELVIFGLLRWWLWRVNASPLQFRLMLRSSI